MNAKRKFESVIARALALCELRRQLWTSRSSRSPVRNLRIDDLLRSALMLGVSAMDAYYRDKFLERLIPFVKKKSATRTLEKALQDAGVSMGDVLSLLGNRRPLRSLRNKVADWLLSKPMHDLDQVDGLFVAFGLKNLTEHAAKKDGAVTIRRKVADAVARRHDIVHYGDYYGGRTSLKTLTNTWTRRRLNWISRLVSQSEDMINSATS